MLGRALVDLPVHAERLVVEDLKTIHADVALARDRITREDHGQCDVAPRVSRPAADDRQRRQRGPVRFDDLLTGRRAHALGPRLDEVEHVGDPLQLVEERARDAHVEQFRHTRRQLVQSFDAERRRHALRGAERIDEDRGGEALHVLEEERHVLAGGALRDAIGDLGDLEIARDRRGHSTSWPRLSRSAMSSRRSAKATGPARHSLL